MKTQTINTKTADYICSIAEKVYGTNPKAILSTRLNTISRSAVSVYLSELQFSNVCVGKYIGKDHSTVAHYRKKHPDHLKYDKEYRDLYNSFLQNIRVNEYLGKF